MSWLSQILQRRRIYHDLAEEMRQHLEERTEQLMREGMSHTEAEQAARRAFGNCTLIEERSREVWQWPSLECLSSDIRYAFRQLRRSPIFGTVAVTTLAVGIGVNTTLFSAIDGLLLRPPADIQAPDKLLGLYQTLPSMRGGRPMPVWSYPDYLYYRNRSDVFSGLAAYSPIPVDLREGAASTRTFGELASGNYFAVRGTKAILGRTFLSADDSPTAPFVAVLSYECWQSQFGGDPRVLGKAIAINGALFTVIGVVPKDTTDVGVQTAPAIWVPLAAEPYVDWPPGEANTLENRGTGWLTVLGRLKPGVTRQQAIANLELVAQQLGQDYPAMERGRGILAELAMSLPSFMSGPVTGIVVLLEALGALLLVIPCANISSLMLARSWSRSYEMAVRSALGASRSRILQQLLTESVLIGVLSAAVGLLLSFFGARALVHFKPPISLPLALDIRPDIRVLGFTVLLAVVTAILFGSAPALQLSRVAAAARLGGRPGMGSRRRSKTQRVLLAAQVGISFLLLVGAGLSIKSLRSAERIDPGFDTRNILSFTVSPRLSGYTNERAEVYYRDLLDRLGTTHGVQSVSLAALMPLSYGHMVENIGVLGGSNQSGQQVQAGENLVAPEYFRTIGIPFVRGRDFLAGGGDKTSVILNQTLAQQFFPDQDPVGRQLEIGDGQTSGSLRIVGVVRDCKYRTLGESPQPFFYRLFAAGVEGPEGTTVLVRTLVEPQSLIHVIHSQVEGLDKTVPLTAMETMSEHMQSALWLARTMATLLGILGVTGLVLAMIGLYGSVAYSVARRTNEIGIRMALGAQRKEVLSLIIKEGLFLTLSGLGPGIVLALLLTRFLRGLLYGVSPTDPVALSAASLLFMLVALAASYIPARRAASIDPMQALRTE